MDLATHADIPLFKGMDAQGLEEMAKELHAHEERYQRDELILRAGSLTHSLGIVLSGSVTIESNDVWGTRTILGFASAGEVFAETYALLPAEPLLVDVRAHEACRILFIRISLVPRYLAAKKPWAIQLATSLLMTASRKNLMLSRRSFLIASKSVREKVMAYLNAEAIKHKADTFEIPFNRQQLADYLNVERTALSKELSRMQSDGYISFRKNRFTILAEAV
ncbi:MAG: Crp/Fnr family transcriptional regulator [Atopobiaceae bacterium]|jgi:CRP-like cAMP-binding protein|nr:Crp/Fnr family transcriptional regulator [Atopobiaceae bacterium]MCI1539651.1 Crp/Fnr family transcriptional regulator [Atopobiaceae bacterium]